MNQENNLNTQSNNGIPNNQPLQNSQGFNTTPNQSMSQNTNVNPTTFNTQSMYQQSVQPAPNFQQQINNVQPTTQPLNSFESGNINNVNVSNIPPKKRNFGLIIGVVIVVLVIVVAIIIFKFATKDNKNNSTQTPSELYTYSDLFNNSSVFESSLCFSLDNKYSVKSISNNKISLDYVDDGLSYNVSIAEYANFDDSDMFHYGLNYDVNNIKTILNNNELKFKVDTNGKTYLNDNDFVHYCNYDYLHNGKVISIYGSICDPIENYSQERIEQIKSIFVDEDNCVNVYDKLSKILFLNEYYIKDTKNATLSQNSVSLSQNSNSISICTDGSDCFDWTTADYTQSKTYDKLEILWMEIDYEAKVLIKNKETNDDLILLISNGSSTAPTIDESYSIFNQIFTKK